MANYMIAIGGLMRCCLDRHPEHENENQRWPTDPKDGDTLDCPHGCGSKIVFDAERNVMRWLSEVSDAE